MTKRQRQKIHALIAKALINRYVYHIPKGPTTFGKGKIEVEPIESIYGKDGNSTRSLNNEAGLLDLSTERAKP
jgi:hypothetical protein